MQLRADPPVSEPELLVLRRALDEAALWPSMESRATPSGWSRATALEAVDNEPECRRHALSPRSTRGATRA
jgi:hypothetical protein